jgi:hypothetical protein
MKNKILIALLSLGFTACATRVISYEFIYPAARNKEQIEADRRTCAVVHRSMFRQCYFNLGYLEVRSDQVDAELSKRGLQRGIP